MFSCSKFIILTPPCLSAHHISSLKKALCLSEKIQVLWGHRELCSSWGYPHLRNIARDAGSQKWWQYFQCFYKYESYFKFIAEWTIVLSFFQMLVFVIQNSFCLNCFWAWFIQLVQWKFSPWLDYFIHCERNPVGGNSEAGTLLPLYTQWELWRKAGVTHRNPHRMSTSEISFS